MLSSDGAELEFSLKISKTVIESILKKYTAKRPRLRHPHPAEGVAQFATRTPFTGQRRKAWYVTQNPVTSCNRTRDHGVAGLLIAPMPFCYLSEEEVPHGWPLSDPSGPSRHESKLRD